MIQAAKSASAMVPSSQRAIPLRRRDDLVIERIEYQGVGSYVIKDPVALKYHRLQPEQHHVLRLLDGERSLEDLRDDLQRHFPMLHLNLPDVQHLITDLHKKGLVYSDRPGQGAALLKQERKNRREKIGQTFKNLLYLRLPGWDPENTLRVIYPFFRWMFRPWAVTAATVFVASAMLVLLIQFDTFRSKIPEFQQFFGWPNLIYLWITLGIAKVIHEFGHGLSCKHFQGECHQMGVMLLVFSPCLYCDVSDSWMLKNKWKRIAIAGAGMYIEVILSAIAIYIWLFTEPGLLNYLALNTFFVTSISTVIFNANPLMRFDGYYMLADFMEIPNLRPKADRQVRDWFGWYCLGIEPKPDPFMPDRGKIWFFLFAVSAAIYRWFIVFGITIFLYTVLKPYGLQSIGIAAAVLSMGSMLYGMLSNLYKMVTASRSEPLSKPKIAVSLVVFAVVLACVLFIPIPWFFDAAFMIEPHENENVYVTTPGRLKKLHVEPGDYAKENELLAELENIEKEDRYRALLVEREAQVKLVDMYYHLEDTAQEKLAWEKLQSLDKQIADYEAQLEQLRIVAPRSGTVVEPPRLPEPSLEASQKQLSTWHGSPLSERNQDAFLQERTHLLSIAPDEKYRAVLVVDQSDRNDLHIGQRVRLKFNHLPDKVYTGKVEDISERHLEFAPPGVSNKYGGSVPTVSDPDGRERLTSIAYQATIVLDEDPGLMLTGMRGKARFYIDDYSAGLMLWRYIRRTFHFRL